MNLQNLIDKELLRRSAERSDRERSGKWNPSSFGRCFRAQYWNREDKPKSNPINLAGLKRITQGIATHELIQKFLPKDIVEVKVETDDVLGYCDILLEEATIDIKGTEDWKFKRYKDIPTPVYVKNNPNEFLQVGFYAMELNRKYCIIRPNVFGCLDNYVLHIQETVLWIPAIQQELATLRGYWVKRELPPAQPRAYGGKECDYCNWRDVCKEVEDARTNNQ